MIGQSPERAALEKTIEGRRVDGRQIRLSSIEPAGDGAGCHVVFITGEDTAEIDAFLDRARGRLILTIAELDRFDQRGGVVQFWLESSERSAQEIGVRFLVNHEVADRSGLRISSKVLRHARTRRGD